MYENSSKTIKERESNTEIDTEKLREGLKTLEDGVILEIQIEGVSDGKG